jgi:hypothetical protein
MKNPISALRVLLSIALVMSPSGGPIVAQNSQAGGAATAQQLPPHKLAPVAESKPAASASVAVRQPESAVAGSSLTIDAGSGRHAISPYIYGINYNQVQIPDINPSIIRWGGDATSQYNWQAGPQQGNTNAGSDYFFKNGQQSSTTDPPDFDTFFATNHTAGVQTIGTIPINGWVAKDSSSCGFSVTKYGAQWQQNGDCGNGVLPDQKTPVSQVKTTDPTDADVQVNTSFMQDWVAHMVSTVGSTANGGVAIWQLDNEPVWWSNVHQNIHPILPNQSGQGYTSFDEVWQKGLAYSQAIKAADPTAKVAGPITSGWSDLFFSRVDMQSGWGTGPSYVYWGNPVDRQAHGNQDFAAWYLQQFAHQSGPRLLDYFDIHGYMPGTGTALRPNSLPASAPDPTDPASNAARLESTRVFWDPNFVVANKSGTLFSADNSSHSAQTGNWVTDGMTFALVDGSGTLLAQTTVALEGSTTITPSSISYSSGASITASPNPIPANEFFVGQATISWSAPGSTGVQVFIGDGEYLSNECVCLIPRMKNWVNANYPGTKMSITEYNLGAQGDINGALAETDVLGIFGREGLDVGVMWPFLGYPDIPLNAPITYAFRMYRNYDGAKSTFGDTGVSAVSGDQSQLSVYAAQRTSDSALTVMVINKTSNDLTSSVSLANFSPQSTAKVFNYSAANLTAIQPQPTQAVTPTGFSATFPANSATLLVIPLSAPPSITANPNPIPVAAGVTVGQTTISWSAPGSSSVELHVGSATGVLFGGGASTGSAQTGDWVTNGMAFVLVDGATHAELASTTVTLTASGGNATIAANPNPIPVATGVTVGQTTISWNAPSSSSVELHIGSATGVLFGGGGSTGSAQTGDWVTNGMVFVLVDAATHATLASTTVMLGSSGAAATITANPNPIPVAAGVLLGQTTISWSAPASSSVEVHVGTATGVVFAGGASSGSAQTGDWVTNGMLFVLVDGATHATLASTTVTLGASSGTPTITANPNPIPGATVGETTISWNAPGFAGVEVHIGSATGTLFAGGGSSGSAETGEWVSNGMVFVLVDATTHATLAATTVSLTGT